jgi:hypothetical protein
VGSPVLHPDLLAKWPAHQATVVGLGPDVLKVFEGPRVLFPDGFSKDEQNVRAVYYDGPASFTHSIGVIAGPKEDSALLQFVAVYLRSTLARYFLTMRGWKMLCERNGVHLSDVETFPFFTPDDAPDPEAARTALKLVEKRMTALTALADLEQTPRYESLRDELDDAIFAYFGLTGEEQMLVRETVDILMPSVRPRSFKSLDTPAQHRVEAGDFDIYAGALAEALTAWRTKTHGEGRFLVDVLASDPRRAGPSGIVRISYQRHPTSAAEISTKINDELALTSLAELRRVGLQAVPSGDFLTLVPDLHLWIDESLYLVRPLARRNWTRRQAHRDAEHIVRSVQTQAYGQKKAEIA